jgi:hypothetical protein
LTLLRGRCGEKKRWCVCEVNNKKGYCPSEYLRPYEYIAIHDYKGDNILSNDMTAKFCKGSIILSDGIEVNGWIRGEMDGKQSIFAKDYLKGINSIDELIRIQNELKLETEINE